MTLESSVERARRGNRQFVMRHEATQTHLESVPEHENQSTYAHLDASSSNSRPAQTPSRTHASRTFMAQTEAEELELARMPSDMDTGLGNGFGPTLRRRDRGDRNRFYSEREGDESAIRELDAMHRTVSNRPAEINPGRLHNMNTSPRVSRFGVEEAHSGHQTQQRPVATHHNRKRLRRVKKGRQTYLELVTVRSGNQQTQQPGMRILESVTRGVGSGDAESSDHSSAWTDGSGDSEFEGSGSEDIQGMGEQEDTSEVQEQEFDERMGFRGRNISDYHYQDSSEDEET